MDRSVLFIDGAYFAKVLKNEYGEPRIDFLKLSGRLCEGTERLRTYYYNCMPYQSSPPTDEERERYSRADKFVYTLESLPRFEVRLGKLSYVRGEYVQKRVDILLAVDLVRMSWGRQIQRAILVTGDSDFVPAVQAAKDAGVLVQIYFSPNAIHDELLDVCDDRFEITSDIVDAVVEDSDVES
ncbi:MAG: NYN domain-containing protein [Thermoplasmata archaeon]|nr:NYN domain-containing protein [Thermoplasmata archaeon]